MEDLLEFIIDLKNKGVFIQEQNAQLRVTGNISLLAEDDKQRIKNHKAALLDLLKSNSNDNKSSSKIPPAGRKAHYLLSSSQKRMWVLSQFKDGNIAHNIPGIYVFEGNLQVGAL